MTRAYILLAAAAVPAQAAARQVPEVSLARPEVRVEEPFSFIGGIVPLADGKVLITDYIDETFQRLDPRTGRAEVFGRKGAGPGEYKGPDALFPLGDGRVLLTDLGNGRLSIFEANGTYLRSMPIAQGSPAEGLTMVMPRGADARGRLYFQGNPRPGGGTDSAAVVRYDPATSRSDTLGRIKPPDLRVTSSGGPNNRSMSATPVPLSPEDVWAAAPDGRIVLVRSSDYRVEWLGADGRVVRGPANSWRPVPVREADKKEWLDLMATSGISMAVTNENGRINMQFGRGMRGGREPDPSQYEWPQAKPAFRSVIVAANGDAWVERHVPAGQPVAYDVFGADGRLKQRVTLPSQRRVIGFAPGFAYVRHTVPADGLQYLEVYRIP